MFAYNRRGKDGASNRRILKVTHRRAGGIRSAATASRPTAYAQIVFTRNLLLTTLVVQVERSIHCVCLSMYLDNNFERSDIWYSLI